MAMQKGQNVNRPKTGPSIKVKPIRDMKAIKRIKKILADQPRNLCLFTLGINSAYRANELLSLTVDHYTSGLFTGRGQARDQTKENP